MSRRASKDELTSPKNSMPRKKYLINVTQHSLDGDDVDSISPTLRSRNERLSESLETHLLSEMGSTNESRASSRTQLSRISEKSNATEKEVVEASDTINLQGSHQGSHQPVKEEAEEPKIEPPATPKKRRSESEDIKRLPMQRLLSLARKEFRSFAESDNSSTPLTIFSIEEGVSPRVTHLTDPTDETTSGITTTSIAQLSKFSTASTATDKKFKFVDDTEEASSKRPSISEEGSVGKPDEEEPSSDVRAVSGGMRLEYGRAPTACERFMNVEDYAKIFVDNIAEEATLKGRSRQQRSNIHTVDGIEYSSRSYETLSIGSMGTYVCVLEWPTIENFNIDIGTEKITEYVSYWHFTEDWKYCINFLYGQSDAACDFYCYEAIFSIPCKQYPIPQATASVYFTFEAPRIKPKTCLVDLLYVFESQRLVHKPSKIFTFQEEMLLNIVDAKIKFYKTLRF